MLWEINSNQPIYLQIMERIQSLIISGYYKPGDRLPSIRDFAATASINPNTMQKALNELEKIDLIYTNKTNGKFITEDTNVIQNLKNQISIQYIRDFIEKMMDIGLNEKDIIKNINQYIQNNLNNE
ncbi:MAG TPA: GntR family transcriptional regulator [Clostridiales bacterium]|nr:GntR family transcriptional regulator [Clostridiales bacterium]